MTTIACFTVGRLQGLFSLCLGRFNLDIYCEIHEMIDVEVQICRGLVP